MPRTLRQLRADRNYSMVIQWSDEDQSYVVTLPEWEAAGEAGGRRQHDGRAAGEFTQGAAYRGVGCVL
jgi:hypothetical protein